MSYLGVVDAQNTKGGVFVGRPDIVPKEIEKVALLEPPRNDWPIQCTFAPTFGVGFWDNVQHYKAKHPAFPQK